MDTDAPRAESPQRKTEVIPRSALATSSNGLQPNNFLLLLVMASNLAASCYYWKKGAVGEVLLVVNPPNPSLLLKSHCL